MRSEALFKAGGEGDFSGTTGLRCYDPAVFGTNLFRESIVLNTKHWSALSSRIGFAFAISGGLSQPCQADDARYSLMFSPYTIHFNPSSEHRQVWLAGLERQDSANAVAGAAFFTNSFGQPSVFLYPFGKTYPGPIRVGSVTAVPEQWYVKWAAGLLYGYKGAYEDKVPFNKDGFSPGVILSLGRNVTERSQFQLNMLGANGLMFQLNTRIK